MVLKKITYFIDGKKHIISAKVCETLSSVSRGLLFKKNSPPLFFKTKKPINTSITSYFCKPFKAIWLDENMNAVKILDVKHWKFYIPGSGRYLLEIPLNYLKETTPRRENNRKV